jgi:flagellar protein FlbD
MIVLHKLNDTEIIINAELIESIEICGNTVVNLVTGNRYIVKETKEEIVSRFIDYKKKVYSERKVINPLEGFEKK